MFTPLFKGLFVASLHFFKGLFDVLLHFFKGLLVAKLIKDILKTKKNVFIFRLQCLLELIFWY